MLWYIQQLGTYFKGDMGSHNLVEEVLSSALQGVLVRA